MQNFTTILSSDMNKILLFSSDPGSFSFGPDPDRAPAHVQSMYIIKTMLYLEKSC